MTLGLLSGLFWAMDTVIIGFILAGIAPDTNFFLFAPIISSGLHDLISSVYLWLGRIWQIKKIKIGNLICSKQGLKIILAACLGGPLGMTAYVLSIQELGPGLSAVFSAFTPALGAAMGHIWLKQKLKPHQWIALFISLLGVMLISYPTGTESGLKITFLGLIYAALCVIGWATESVICAKAMQDSAIEPATVLLIRQTFSAIAYVFFSVIIIFSLHDRSNLTAYFINPQIFTLLLITSFLGTISFLTYYKAINILGTGKAMALNITYCVWALIFSALFFHQYPAPHQIIAGIITVSASLVTAGALNHAD